MNELMIKTYTTADLAIQGMIQRQKQILKGERGASALEYVGMVLVAAFIVGAVYAALSGADVKGKVKTAVDGIMNGAPK